MCENPASVLPSVFPVILFQGIYLPWSNSWNKGLLNKKPSVRCLFMYFLSVALELLMFAVFIRLNGYC